MRLLILLSFLLLCSCNQSNIAKEENLILRVLENYIEEDSLYLTEYISPKLLPYIYYQTQYTEDSLEIPPPPVFYNGEHLDEKQLIKRIGNGTYFSQKDEKHIKDQLINSQIISNAIKVGNLSKVDLKSQGTEIKEWYSFYVPIFNSDSSAVYVQYDYHNHNYGDGNGALLVKKNGKWKLLAWFDRWMT